MLSFRNNSKARNQRTQRRVESSPSRIRQLMGQKNSRVPGRRRLLPDLDWGRIRIGFVAAVFALTWLALWGRAWYLQMIEGPYLAQRARKQHISTVLITGRRGEILDRNGQVLARSVESRSVYARPNQISDPLSVANTLAPLLRVDARTLYTRISSTPDRKFIWLERKVDDKAAEAVQNADLPGIGLSKEYTRIYPFKNMAGQLLGFVGMDDKGLEGLERSLDDVLSPTPTRQEVQRDAMGRRFFACSEDMGNIQGADVHLTLDVQIQFFAEKALSQAVETFNASWGGVLVVDIESGDILAWAQYPFFNPNDYGRFTPAQYRNRLALDALEPGSTFKPFLMAAALQEKKVGWDTPVNCENGRWKTKDIVLRDTSSHAVLPANKVLRYSSNIGMAKIGLSMGAPRSYHYLSELGFGRQTALPVAQSRGLVRKPGDWKEADLMSTWFGQSVSVTGLQMARGYLTLLNNGVIKPLRIIKDVQAPGDSDAGDALERLIKPDPDAGKRVYRADVCRELIHMMRDVVEEDGSGKRARVDGVEVGGKTGTAQKIDKRTRAYGDKRLASFVGFLPVDKPRYLIMTMIDEPTNSSYGGVVAAPVFKAVATDTMTYSGRLAEQTSQAEVDKQRLNVDNSRMVLKLSPDKHVFAEELEERQPRSGLLVPGHLARAASRVPNVVGKSVRNAVELFARGGVVPLLKGSGQRVVRQSPEPGAPWPESPKSGEWVLWLSGN